MARFFKTRKRSDFFDAALHMAVTGFPVVGCDAIGLERRVGGKEARGFYIRNKGGVRIELGQVTRHDHTDLIGKDLFAFVIHNATAIAVAIKAKRQIGTGRFDAVGHVVQHFHGFGIGVVVGEGVVQRAVAFDHFDANASENLGRKGGCGAIAGGADNLERAGHSEIADQIVNVGFFDTIHKLVRAAFTGHTCTVQNDVAQFAHLVWAVGQRAVKAHFDTGPAVGVVRGGDHGYRGYIQVELGEIGHWRHGWADVFDFDTRLHQAQDQRVFDRQ